MATMTKRERVMRKVNFEETGRVSVYDITQNDAMTERYSGCKLKIAKGFEFVGMAIGAAICMTRVVARPNESRTVDYGNGFVSRIERYTSWYTRCPFQDLEGMREWVKRLVNAWHTRDTKCIFHSDGELWDVTLDNARAIFETTWEMAT